MKDTNATECLRDNANRLYRAAYRKYGESAATALLKAVKDTAPMYKGLTNKEQYIPLILEKLGVVPCADAEADDIIIPENLYASLEKAYTDGLAAEKKKKLIALFCAEGALLVAGIVLLLCYILKPEPPHIHTYLKEVIPAQCETEGYTRNFCACGDEYKTDITAAKGHSYGEWKTVKKATTSEEGEEVRICTVCGKEEKRSVPKLSDTHTHKYEKSEIIKPASCTEEGTEKLYCTYPGCEAYKENTIPKTAHSYGEWETVTEATKTEPGEKKRVCSVCGNVQSEIIPATDTQNISLPGAKSYKSGNVTISNVHSVSDATGAKPAFEHLIYSEKASAITTAPDGTVYVLLISASDGEKMTDTVTLYKLTAAGWEKLCDFRQKYEGSNVNPKTEYSYVFCDKNSEVYVFIGEREALTAYHYNAVTKTAEVADRFVKNRTHYQCRACSDADYVYFALYTGSGATPCRFDFAERKFTAGQHISNPSYENNSPKDLYCKNGNVYLLMWCRTYYTDGEVEALFLYSIRDYGTPEQKTVYSVEIDKCESKNYIAMYGIGTGNPRIITDDSCVAYVLYDYSNISTKYTWFRLAVVDTEGNITCRQEYETFYAYFGKHYGTEIGGLFFGNNGELYYFEYYDSLSTRFTVCSLSGKDFADAKEVATFTTLNMYQPALLQSNCVISTADGIKINLLYVTPLKDYTRSIGGNLDFAFMSVTIE